MRLNEVMFLVCLVLLFVTKAAVFRTLKNGDRLLARVLTLLRLGLGLSAFAYLLRLLLPASEAVRVASFFCTLAGSVVIWIGGLEHANLRRQRLCGPPAAPGEAGDDALPAATVFPAATGLPRLSAGTQRVLRHAVDEARRRRQCCVDTDHVLLGLLQEKQSVGADILERLDVKPENIRLKLGDPSETLSPTLPESPGGTLPLTDRARQALSLAAQEAHRFDKTAVGTDHLLLGLVLMGMGAAAVSLFQEGVTVDGIRGEIIKGQAA